MTWVIRRLGLTVGSSPVRVPSVRTLTPSPDVVPGIATYHPLNPRRLRITGEGPAVTYELDLAGLVMFQRGHLRLVRQASRKSAKSNPGATTQLTSTGSAPAGSAACHTPAGITACGT